MSVNFHRQKISSYLFSRGEANSYHSAGNYLSVLGYLIKRSGKNALCGGIAKEAFKVYGKVMRYKRNDVSAVFYEK